MGASLLRVLVAIQGLDRGTGLTRCVNKQDLQGRQYSHAAGKFTGINSTRDASALSLSRTLTVMHAPYLEIIDTYAETEQR